MGIEANYRRITAAEWEQLRPYVETDEEIDEWGEGYEAYANIADSDGMRSSDRFLSIDKDWNAIHALLTGDMGSISEIQAVQTPLGNVVAGGTETPFEAGHGEVRFLTPDEVRGVADALKGISLDDLRARFDPIALNKAKIYPRGCWDNEALEPLLFNFRQLVGFFREAAQRGEVILVSFD